MEGTPAPVKLGASRSSLLLKELASAEELASNGIQESVEVQPKISFKEYEAFLDKLESENKLDFFEKDNPKSSSYKEEQAVNE